MKKIITLAFFVFTLSFIRPALLLAAENTSAQQEQIEQQQVGQSLPPAQPSKTKEQIEQVEEKVLGSENHAKFEVVDPIIEKHLALFIGVLVLVAVLLVVGISHFKRKWLKK